MHIAYRAALVGAFLGGSATAASALQVTYNLDAVANDGISMVYGHLTVDATLGQIVEFNFRTTLHDDSTGIDTSFTFDSAAIRYDNPQVAGDINSRLGTEFDPSAPTSWWITGFEGDYVLPDYFGQPVWGGGPEFRHGFTINGGMLFSGHASVPITLSAESEVIQGMYSPYGPPHGFGYNAFNDEHWSSFTVFATTLEEAYSPAAQNGGGEQIGGPGGGSTGVVPLPAALPLTLAALAALGFAGRRRT